MARSGLWRTLTRLGLYAMGAALALVGLVVVALELGWGNDRLRQLAVTQANRYLDATLTIDRLDGSLLRGVRLDGVELAQGGRRVVAIDRVTVGYSLRQLLGGDRGTSVRSLTLERLHVVADRGANGRWNVASLLRPRPPAEPGRQPRPVTIETITLVDASIDIQSPLTFGAARVPSEIRNLDATVAFESLASGWRLSFTRASWQGRSPSLTVDSLTGAIASQPDALAFDRLAVRTPRSSLVLHGDVKRRPSPSVLALDVAADRFSFPEWAEVVPGLRPIDIDSRFTATLEGPLNRLGTRLDLRSTGGAVTGAVTLDTTVPGWHGAGQLDVSSVNLARWLTRPDRPSDITGRIDFDLDLELGRRFPRGRYTFRGGHVAFLGYEADDLEASGEIVEHEARIARATATAYGANVSIDTGAIGIGSPFAYRFTGVADGVDLRRLPAGVPVPHVESTLSFGYDVHGRFAAAHLIGRAEFGRSQFLDVVIAEGASGAIDTSVRPFRYSGEGDVAGLALQRVGAGLDIAWMRDPRYAGTIAGHFRVAGSGGDAATLAIDATGRIHRAELFQGAFSEADVTLAIAAGSLHATYTGLFSTINPAVALTDPRWFASLTGAASVSLDVTDILERTVSLDDYRVTGRVSLGDSAMRRITISDGEVTGTLASGTLDVSARMDSPSFSGHAEGTIELDGRRSSSLTYVHAPIDLALVGELLGRALSGSAIGRGRLTGPIGEPHVAGTARVSLLTLPRVEVVDTTLEYAATIPRDRPWAAAGRAQGAFDRLTAGGLVLDAVSGAVTFDHGTIGFEVGAQHAGRAEASLRGGALLHVDERALDLTDLSVAWRGLAWQHVPAETTRISWDDAGIRISRLTLMDAEGGRQRLGVSGMWGASSSEGLRVTAAGVFLDPFANVFTPPGQVGGTLDGEATIHQSADRMPIVRVTASVEAGRIRRLPFQRVAAQVHYAGGDLDVDSRIDQAPGVWLTAAGRVPLGLFDPKRPDAPISLALASSGIDLSLVEGVTDVVRDLSGQLQMKLTVVGTSHDPHFEGAVDLTDAAFAVRSSGARYQNGRAAIRLSRDRVVVEAFRIEDGRNRALTVSGSLGTHELKVEDLAVDVTASGFEVLRNEFGTLEVDADLKLRGEFESPRLAGTITIAGGALNVDEILDRTLLLPYSTESAPPPSGVDAIAALNPWDRLGLDIAIHTPDRKSTL